MNRWTIVLIAIGVCLALYDDQLISFGQNAAYAIKCILGAFEADAYFNLNFTPGCNNRSEADLPNEIHLPSCVRNPLSSDQLEPNAHLAIVGHVFDISNVLISGNGAPKANEIGLDVTDHFLGISPSERYGLDGITTIQLSDTLRRFVYFVQRYKCIGYLPGLYFDPMGEPTEYIQDLLKLWRSLARDEFRLRNILPDCTVHKKGFEILVLCSPLKNNDGTSVLRYPRLFYERTRLHPRCACVNEAMLNYTGLREFADCELLEPICKIFEKDEAYSELCPE